MAVLKQWTCAKHGVFTCSHPICSAQGCASSHVIPGAWPLRSPPSASAPSRVAEPIEPESRLAAAKRFLRTALQPRPLPVRDIHARATEAGLALITLKRAKAGLGVTSIKHGGNFGATEKAEWHWELP